MNQSTSNYLVKLKCDVMNGRNVHLIFFISLPLIEYDLDVILKIIGFIAMQKKKYINKSVYSILY